MALTDEQKAFRSKVIGGSDVNIIMGGDDDKILQLWRLKRGEVQDEDLSDVLQVQMGVFTEPFNIQWFQKHTKREVTDNGVQKIHPVHSFMGCSLDGLTDSGKTVFEAKHVSAFSNADEIQERYMPQLYHNMSVCGVERAVLSVFYGNHKWECYDIKRDPIFAMIVEDAAEKFWQCVLTGEPPVTVVNKGPVDAIRRVDMTGNNMWASLSRQYQDNLEAKALCDGAVDQLKAMVEPDVMEAWGHGIRFKRDKRGALRLSNGR